MVLTKPPVVFSLNPPKKKIKKKSLPVMIQERGSLYWVM